MTGKSPDMEAWGVLIGTSNNKKKHYVSLKVVFLKPRQNIVISGHKEYNIPKTNANTF